MTMEITKQISRQDCYFKLSEGKSGETSINISTEIFELICSTPLPKGANRTVVFTLHRDDFIKGLCFIVNRLPLYSTSSSSSRLISFSYDFFIQKFGEIVNFFGDNDTARYAINLYNRTDGRIYLNNLSVEGFNLRNFLIEELSLLKFSKSNGENVIRLDYKDACIYSNRTDLDLTSIVSEPAPPMTSKKSPKKKSSNVEAEFKEFLLSSKTRRGGLMSKKTASNYIYSVNDPLISEAVASLGFSHLYDMTNPNDIAKLYNIIVLDNRNKEWNYTFSAMLLKYKEFRTSQLPTCSEEKFEKFLQAVVRKNGRTLSRTSISSYLRSAQSSYIKGVLRVLCNTENLYDVTSAEKTSELYNYVLSDPMNDEYHRTPSSMLKYYQLYIQSLMSN